MLLHLKPAASGMSVVGCVAVVRGFWRGEWAVKHRHDFKEHRHALQCLSLRSCMFPLPVPPCVGNAQ